MLRPPTHDEAAALIVCCRAEWRHCKRQVAAEWDEYEHRKSWCEWMLGALRAYRYVQEQIHA